MESERKIVGTCFIGWAGSGKSYIASRLAQRLDVSFIGEYQVDRIINHNILNPELDNYFLKYKDAMEIERLRLHREFDTPFVSDLNFGGIYRIFNRLHNKGTKSYDEIYGLMSENTVENIQNLGLHITSNQTLSNLIRRGESEPIKGLIDKMVSNMNGLLEYLDKHNLFNFKIIDTLNYNPFDVDLFIQKYTEVLPIK